jgi:predicted nucleic acid-binding protein
MRVIVLDANLLVLFVVGATSKDYVARHKRLRAYTAADYDLLCRVIEEASEVLTTPNALTEASNLIAHIADPARSEIRETLQQLTLHLQETYVPSAIAARRAEFVRLGLADAAMLELAGEQRVVLTADFALYQAVLSSGAGAINFNHLRDQGIQPV